MGETFTTKFLIFSTMSKFPYKDDCTGCWIYDQVPDSMKPANLSDLKIGTLILYRGELGSWKDLFIATSINQLNYATAKACLNRGREMYVKKKGV